MAKTTRSTPRTAKTAAAKAVDATIKSETIKDPVTGQDVHPEDVRPWSYDTLKAKLAAFEMPTWTRTVLAWVGGILTWGCTYYIGMSFVMTLANIALFLTGSGLLTFLIILLGYIATQIAGLYSGFRVHGFITNFDGHKAADAMAAVPGKITGWFSRVKTAAQAV